MNKDYKSINNLWKDSEGYRYFGTLKLSSKIKYDGDDFIPLWEWINQLQQENKILKENAENNDKVVDKVNWENMLLKKENKQLNGAIQTYDILLKSNIEENQQLKDELKSKPDAQITLQDDKGNKFMVIQTERIDMQVELNKTIEKLFNNWNKIKEYFNERIEVCDNRLSSPFCNFEKATKERLIFSQCLEKLEELEGSDSNVKD